MAQAGGLVGFWIPKNETGPGDVSELTARFDLPLGRTAPGAARRAVIPVLREWAFRDEDWLQLAAMVVSELVANAVVHGGGCLSLQVQAHDGLVTVAATDSSAAIPRRTTDPDQWAEGGRGIAIIEALGCEWGVHDHQGGKRVWARLPAHPPSGEALAGSS